MLADVFDILSKRHLSSKQRLQLVYFFVKLRTIRFFANRLFSEKSVKHIRGLGFTFNINTLSEFYWTFKEVFIGEEYFFQAKTENPQVIDCGGHIGLAVLYVKWLYPKAIIKVFEPLPFNFNLLKMNVEQNKLSGIVLHQKAVSDTVGRVSFTGSGRAGHITATESDDAIEVETVKLSNYVDGAVAFCKIDIEGAESVVIAELDAARKLYKIERIVMEYHKKAENSLGSIITHLEKNNFMVSFNSSLDPLKPSPRDFSHIMLVAVKD